LYRIITEFEITNLETSKLNFLIHTAMDNFNQEVTKTQTYYEILEISDENAPIEQIKQQYQKLLLLVSFLVLYIRVYTIGFFSKLTRI